MKISKFKEPIAILALMAIEFFILLTEWASLELLKVLLGIALVLINISILYLSYRIFERIKGGFYRLLVAILLAITTIGVSFIGFIINLFSFKYQNKYIFDDKIFSIYSLSFRDICYKVYIDGEIFRDRLITICDDKKISLSKRGDIIYLNSSSRGDIKIYNLKESKRLYLGE